MALVALALVLLSGWLLNRTAWGIRLSAIGQNLAAARLAGIGTSAAIAAAFVVSGVFSALAGLLLSAYVGGAFLDMGRPFLLQSIGAVVLGGSLIFGGASTALGTALGALFLALIVTVMQVAGLPAGAQDVTQGALIVAVLALAGLDARLRARRASARRRAVSRR